MGLRGGLKARDKVKVKVEVREAFRVESLGYTSFNLWG